MAHPAAITSVGATSDHGAQKQHAAGASGQRRGYLDWLRGLGVLIMIEAHTIDSWTRVADRGRPAYRWALVVGGFGAPIFLFLAGVAMALAARSRLRRGMTDSEACARARRRGWQVFGYAFLFRLQSLVISGGGMRAFLKVDILNVMGVAMLIASGLWTAAKTPRGRAAALATAAVLTAMATPIVRSSQMLSWLPDGVEDYLRPAPNRTTFTLFPWAGFLFAGAVAGLWLDWSGWGDERRRNLVLLAAGTAIAAGGYATSWLPSLYDESAFWTSSPTFFFLRLGLLVAAIPLAYAWMSGWAHVARRFGMPAWFPLQQFGISSLFVYWIHVEMVYGVASTPLHRTLSFEQALGAMALFALFLFALVLLKQHYLSRPKGERQAKFARFVPVRASGGPQSG